MFELLNLFSKCSAKIQSLFETAKGFLNYFYKNINFPIFRYEKREKSADFPLLFLLL